MVKITYVWHDCFVVETESAMFVFDYWLDADGTPAEMPEVLASADRDKTVYVLVSHGHKDHYNPAVFSWVAAFRDVRYVVSRDVMKRIRHVVSATSVYSGPKVDPECVSALRPGERFSAGGVVIAAFPSTDIGNSYIVEADGHRFFHAGDLNAWIWKDESTEAEVRKAMGDYRACLRDIRAYLDHAADQAIDYCFFPVDSRIGTDYFTGASIFVREFDVRKFFPMHFALGDEEERSRRRTDALRFCLYANPERGEYIPLAWPGALYVDASPSDR
ncbi:MAG: MBL fold metallo-hydrolase [Muribaculaceae bacterium]|nr:MBL fold metallo-hydrolase [Muribaculaceae bacterium]